jgi:hypothetical protein
MAHYRIATMRMYGIYNVVFGLMGSAIAVTASAAERAELAEDGFNAELAEYAEENT